MSDRALACGQPGQGWLARRQELLVGIVLIAGLWLCSEVWDDVARALGERGHRAVAVRLPGQGDGDTTATLADQEAAVLAAVDGTDRPLVVGHSAAAGLAWLAADRAMGSGACRQSVAAGPPQPITDQVSLIGRGDPPTSRRGRTATADHGPGLADRPWRPTDQSSAAGPPQPITDQVSLIGCGAGRACARARTPTADHHDAS